jgi:UDP-N-acetylmuramoyl-L-alanyl-D-glutamate--2,6-diaminopimelate ligase
MLNNDELGKILNESIPQVLINDIHWRTQDSTPQSILFYKLTDDTKSEQLFLDRIKDSQYAWLVINRSVQNIPRNVSIINEELWTHIQKKILDRIYPQPKIKMIGITGTNGKTTTADLVLQIGHLAGRKGFSIGTLGVREYNKTLLDFGLTSPSFIDFRKYLYKYGVDKDFCVTEVSSHALVQDRLCDISFDAAGWLSFSQDHLDYHQTMDKYYDAKSLILNKLLPNKKLFVPSEQKDLFDKLKRTSSKANMAPEIAGELPLFFRTQFNKNNLEVAKALIESAFNESVTINYDSLLPPDGRFYIRAFRNSYIVVDYAHTPDALKNICQGIKKTFPNYKLKVLFGCGGDRDRLKRPIMASVVADWADEIYVTSDNPRSENPEQIISDILSGIKGKKFQSITERPKAVNIAFSELKDNEVLLLAGKGHEDYILINGVKHPYSDIREVEEFISRNKI